MRVNDEYIVKADQLGAKLCEISNAHDHQREIRLPANCRHALTASLSCITWEMILWRVVQSNACSQGLRAPRLFAILKRKHKLENGCLLPAVQTVDTTMRCNLLKIQDRVAIVEKLNTTIKLYIIVPETITCPPSLKPN